MILRKRRLAQKESVTDVGSITKSRVRIHHQRAKEPVAMVVNVDYKFHSK